jgi:hypothetical protein
LKISALVAICLQPLPSDTPQAMSPAAAIMGSAACAAPAPINRVPAPIKALSHVRSKRAEPNGFPSVVQQTS